MYIEIYSNTIASALKILRPHFYSVLCLHRNLNWRKKSSRNKLKLSSGLGTSQRHRFGVSALYELTEKTSEENEISVFSKKCGKQIKQAPVSNTGRRSSVNGQR
ncbi:hypothetical protein TNCV_3345381 [Trichonephila clavipes]|nr:hypothetical protein TNCV_3345381 [Trichonephila clavipes]